MTLGTGTEAALITDITFWVIAISSIVAAIAVVQLRDLFRAALFLVVSFAGIAGLFILLRAEFLAVVQVLVYGGAVTILILFAMMLTRVRDIAGPIDGPQRPVAAVAATIFLGTTVLAVTQTEWRGNTEEATVVSINEIGNALFTTWAMPFEIASLVLMVALVGAIVLARGEEGE